MKKTLLRFSLVIIALAGGIATPSKIHAAAGDLYDGGLNQNVVFRFTPTGARSAFVLGPYADFLAFDARGNLFVSDPQSAVISKITPAGSISTFASGLTPTGLAFDAAGNLFAGDSTSRSIFKYSPTGVKTTFATGITPNYLAFDRSENLFVSVTGATGPNGSIVKFDRNGVRSTFAAGLFFPQGIAFDGAGNLFEADLGSSSIQKFTPLGVKSTFASSTLLVGGVHLSPRSLAFDRSGNLFDGEFGNNRILKFAPNATATIFASGIFVGGIAFEPGTAIVDNISTRAFVGTGNNVLIGGFILNGVDSKQVVIRGIGPFLTQFGVPGALQDPTLELHRNTDNAIIASNNDWQSAPNAGQIPQKYRPTFPQESVILTTLPPGGYTVIEAGNNNTTGVGLVEVYDIATGVNSLLGNISTRGFVKTGDERMIGGFVTEAGNGKTDVVVRAIGPSLTPFGITNPLPNPTLELRDVNGALVRSNDNWKESQQVAIQASGFAPSNDLESAIFATLPVGSYTAIVADKTGGTGVGLVEVYKLR